MKGLKTDFLLIGTLVFEVVAAGFLLQQVVYSKFDQVTNLALTQASDGIFISNTPVQNSTTTVLIFGDMMLDRSVRGKINQFGAEYSFALVKDFLVGHDIVVANAEGPFTSNPSKTLGVKNGPLVFTFDPAILPTLKNLGFTLLGQANNHTLNFGTIGLKQSEKSIEQAGLAWFGDPSNQDLHSFATTTHGQKIAIVGYHQFATGLSNVISEIQSLKQQGNFVIVYPHWGEEYLEDKTDIQIKIAHAFVDAGADAVIGSHPHVVEPIEIYKNKIIFYSLGNFIFDQAQSGPTSEDLSINMSITPTKVTYNLFPLKILQEQASIMVGDERTELLNNLAKKSLVDDSTKEAIRSGAIDLTRL